MSFSHWKTFKAMFINITTSETGNNRGSSGALVNYLEKENHLRDEKGRPFGQEFWFNGSSSEIARQEVRVRIDGNIAKLGRNDSKFFLINMSPSQKELAHLYGKYGEVGAKAKLKAFAVKVMDGYAANFKRPGIGSNVDLLWYGKYENFRYYSHSDKEVRDGARQRGERKEGRQEHIQIIVSRKDVTNTIKLSPMNTSRGKNMKHSAKLGEFNRTAFKQLGETLFDREFGFDRGLKETLDYASTMKNGTADQRAQMEMLASVSHPARNELLTGLGRLISEGKFDSLGELICSAKSDLDIVKILMDPAEVSVVSNPVEEAEKRKRKKKKENDQSHGLGM